MSQRHLNQQRQKIKAIKNDMFEKRMRQKQNERMKMNKYKSMKYTTHYKSSIHKYHESVSNRFASERSRLELCMKRSVTK